MKLWIFFSTSAHSPMEATSLVERDERVAEVEREALDLADELTGLDVARPAWSARTAARRRPPARLGDGAGAAAQLGEVAALAASGASSPVGPAAPAWSCRSVRATSRGRRRRARRPGRRAAERSGRRRSGSCAWSAFRWCGCAGVRADCGCCEAAGLATGRALDLRCGVRRAACARTRYSSPGCRPEGAGQHQVVTRDRTLPVPLGEGSEARYGEQTPMLLGPSWPGRQRQPRRGRRRRAPCAAATAPTTRVRTCIWEVLLRDVRLRCRRGTGGRGRGRAHRSRRPS
jgi:hypothetical protein